MYTFGCIFAGSLQGVDVLTVEATNRISKLEKSIAVLQQDKADTIALYDRQLSTLQHDLSQLYIKRYIAKHDLPLLHKGDEIIITADFWVEINRRSRGAIESFSRYGWEIGAQGDIEGLRGNADRVSVAVHVSGGTFVDYMVALDMRNAWVKANV